MAIDRIDEPGDEDLEYYSQCCVAPPLYELNGIMGICMKCREHATFELWGDEDPYEIN